MSLFSLKMKTGMLVFYLIINRTCLEGFWFVHSMAIQFHNSCLPQAVYAKAQARKSVGSVSKHMITTPK